MRKPGKGASDIMAKNEAKRNWFLKKGPLLISLAIMFFFLAFSFSKGRGKMMESLHTLELVEAKATDIRFQIMQQLFPQQAAPEVVIAAIDDRAVDYFGWPFPRREWANFLARMREYGAAVVAYDVVFTDEGQYQGYEFIKDTMAELDRLGLTQSRLPPIRRCGEARGLVDGVRQLREFLAGEEQKANQDRIFAAQLQTMNKVVLGWYGYDNQYEVEALKDRDFADDAEMLMPSNLPLNLKNNMSMEQVLYILRPVTFVGLQTNTPALSKASSQFGFFTSRGDELDGTIRRTPLIEVFTLAESDFNEENTFVYPSLSLAALNAFFQESEGEKPQVTMAPGVGVQRIVVGNRSVVTDERGRILINWVGPQGSFPYYSIYDILTGFERQDKDQKKVDPKAAFKNKIVLVGSTTIGAHDMRTIPFGNAPGVEMHANVISNILQGTALIRPAWFKAFDLLILLALGIVFGVVLPRVSAIVGGIVTLALLIGYIVFNFYLFRAQYYSFTIITPLAEMTTIYFAVTLFRYATEEREKRFIKHSFGHYLSPAIIEQLVNDPSKLKLGGERKVCTAFFSDIQGFSSISEKMDPEKLVPFLNEYLTEMCDIIYKHDGTVDKFEGDAIIAFFGAPIDYPDHAARACRCTVEIQQLMVHLRAGWLKKGLPEIYMRVGLNTGPMVIGNMGSNTRMDYTMMGDSVNLAARLESGGKQYKVYSMISEFTLAAAGDGIAVRELDLIQVVGKVQPVRVYELLGLKGGVDPLKMQVVDLFHQGLKLYRESYWQEAREKFEQALGYDPNDGPSKIFIARCEDFSVDPPGLGWDGVYAMKAK
jgi:adenylate cyclase